MSDELLLQPEDLAYIREGLELLFPDTATVRTIVRSKGSSGASISYNPTGQTISCLLEMGAASVALLGQGGQLDLVNVTTIDIPAFASNGIAIGPQHNLLIGNQGFDVIAVTGSGEWEPYRRLSVKAVTSG